MSEGPGRGDPGDDGAGVCGGFDGAHPAETVHRRLFHQVDHEAGRVRTVDPPAPAGLAGPPPGSGGGDGGAGPAHPRGGRGKALDVLDRGRAAGPGARAR